MASKCKIWPYRPWKMTFRAIQPNLSFDMWFMSPQRSSMPKKKKSYWSVSEIDPSPPQSWRTDGRTDRRTTDKSVLEKLRCLSAGGAKKPLSICDSTTRFHMFPLSKFWEVLYFQGKQGAILSNEQVNSLPGNPLYTFIKTITSNQLLK